jgi:hypothetical protein
MIDRKALAGRLNSAWRWLSGWFWQTLAIVAVLSLAAVWFRPFSDLRDPDAEDVAAAWNASIQRLGISALYPPAEDFYVGDLWAVIVGAGDSPGKQEPHVSTLVGKSVRVTHIDLRPELMAAGHLPVFSDTVEKEQRSSYRKADPVEVDGRFPADRIVTRLTAFPGITITHRTRGMAALDRGVFGFSAGRDDQRTEEIRIPVAETYGVEPSAAFFRLHEWCEADPKTKILCSDQYVRRLLAYSVDNGVLSVENGKYRTRIELRLVTRVFLTREIQHRRSVVGGGGVSGPAAAGRPAKDDASTAGAPGSLDQRVSDALKAAGQAPDASALAGGAGVAVSLARGDGTDIDLNEVFQRPVAFGYRAISIDLDPSPPTGASP